MTEFARKLKMLRELKGWTQDELSKKLGVSRSKIGNYELGIREPGFEDLEAIADTFNCTISYLIADDHPVIPQHTMDYAIKLSNLPPMAQAEVMNFIERDMNIDMGCKIYRSALVPPLPLADDFVPYCLRHTYCTDLCKAGVDVRTAQKLMGHANISVTADIYTHVDIEDIKNARELIEMYNSVNIKNATSNATS